MKTKNTIGDIAQFGGPPLFDRVRPIGQLAVPDPEEFFRLTKQAFDDRRLTNQGPIVAELENRLSQLHEVDFCIANANATLALIILIKALTEGRQGQVIMPAFTYPGLPHIAQWAGQEPQFCDVDRDTHTIDINSVNESISEDTTLIMGVHHVNSPCLIDELTEISAHNGIPLIFDSVHGAHCTYKNKQIGGFGRAEVFSLHATKLLNGFEGGYITTNEPDLAAKLREMRNFGISTEGEVVGLGMNSKLNEIHAAFALSGLEHQDEIVERNRIRYQTYCKEFAGLPGLKWVPYPEEDQLFNYEFSLLEVAEDWPLTRNQTISLLRMENALARPYYDPPLHQSSHCPAGIAPVDLPVTEELSRRFIQMPVGEQVALEDITTLACFFNFLAENAGEINARLSSSGGA